MYRRPVKALSNIVLGPPSNIFSQLVLILWMATLSSCLIWQIISFILNNYGCVYAWQCPAKWACRFWQKKHLLGEAHFDLGGYVNKQNYRIWGTENPQAYIEKRAHPKRETVVRCGFWHNWAISLRKWARSGHYHQWRSLSGHFKRIFVHKNWRGEY